MSSDKKVKANDNIEKGVSFPPDKGKSNWVRTLEFRDLANSLVYIHSVFYQIHEMGGQPVFTDTPNVLPTACIKFDFKYGSDPVFMFDSGFWDHLTEYERAFIICHECLHVLYNHGDRLTTIAMEQPLLLSAANVAADIAINHSLVNHFGFKRHLIRNADECCWVDTVFPNENVPDNKNFEWYLNKILKDNPPNIIKVSLMDDHGELSSGGANAGDEEGSGKKSGKGKNVKKFIDELAEKLTDHEKESLKNVFESNYDDCTNKDKQGDAPGGKQAGNQSGNITKVVIKKKRIPKRKWETVIKDWSMGFKPKQKMITQWAHPNRRIPTNLSSKLVIPYDRDEDTKVFDMIEVWFFQDTSGSCAHLAERFFNAARTLPPDRFVVRMHCFDTKVYKTDLESGKLYGFGGTSFKCIKNFIDAEMSKIGMRKHPAVFVITDGYGDHPGIEETVQRQWYWFLSESYKHCIPSKCNVYELSDYE